MALSVIRPGRESTTGWTSAVRLRNQNSLATEWTRTGTECFLDPQPRVGRSGQAQARPKTGKVC